ncbi:uncharacterized protein DUF1990 [Pseudonocardia sediminis]|uniref:Uncharacterized protein DUF1990 n=1 Tax=Pseudonocardia sediminis TaxID=1397368 RepID=A0A4V2FQN2_PSEST|nr:DUF1990 family protein [Pseudonocardia sediminis]RZT85030.1 uncharacterized protein DUF1990 [Pseudonocardia sediminis]
MLPEFGMVDIDHSELDALKHRSINFDHADSPTDDDHGDWHVDLGVAAVGTEAPGPPEPDGVWETACRIVRDYQFTDHGRLRGIFRPSDELMGRDMLLQGRFAMMRFYLGVRVTDIVDTEQDGHRVWGWTYETLEGHLEQGRLTYEVDKDLATGDVVFRIRAFSRRSPVPNPFYRFGFTIFGRAVQLEFYHHAGQRIRDLVAAHRRGEPVPRPTEEADGEGDGVVVAPHDSPTPWSDRVAIHVRHPGA